MSNAIRCDICGATPPTASGFLNARRRFFAWNEALWGSVDICPVCVLHIKRMTKTGLCRVDPCPTCGCERVPRAKEAP